jgi:hypothetical protein
MIWYLAIVEVAESSDFFGFVKDIAGDFHISHDAELLEVLEQISSGDLGGNGDRILRQFEVGWLSLRFKRTTSSIVACEAVAKLKMRGVFCNSRSIKFINLSVKYVSNDTSH